ncbi:MAG: AGE family epimerase/isomerase [Lachnospiraceae bacterium]|nr:AGE family epimerase/isomerase [Lachnospiraceae bacterium]
MSILKDEAKKHLTEVIIPFWMSLRDREHGGYYSYVDNDLNIDKKAFKGCILNSRIMWFFSNAYMLLKDEKLLDEARNAFRFFKSYCYDRENGGVYWSVEYNGKIKEDVKYTYNQAFAIYALSSYYAASKNEEALKLAEEIYEVIENKCCDDKGYLEAGNREFRPVSNEELSENGVIASRTMNTLLHVMEAYTELYRVTGLLSVRKSLERIIGIFTDHIYNPEHHRQEVFFDDEYRPIIDLHSYGHDIETAWLMDRTIEILGDEGLKQKIFPITKDLTETIFKTAFDGRSLANECENGKVDETRIWWVQAEAVIGFLNGYEKDHSKKEYLDAALGEWDFIMNNIVDQREGSEWLREVGPDGKPLQKSPIVEPWKCPYHNGRMCMEIIKRNTDS